MSKYEQFAAAVALKKRLAIAKQDIVQIKRILREMLVDPKVTGALREMANKLLASYTQEVPDEAPKEPRKQSDRPDVVNKRRRK